ncbi:MAG: hypothetical protein HYS87_03185 [Candidatus Colwellbacteria bacterium]|nr:hypothetical protein [Candidatus Colwellbacteria bacterium]
MNNKLILILLGAALVGFGAWAIINKDGSQEEMQSQEIIEGDMVVEMSDAGFNPEEITISRGTTVTFNNVGTSQHWPASNIHPTHRVYPGSDIEKCGTPEETNIFDACKPLAPGTSWSFTFDEVGRWVYHDHLRSGLGGVITVE